MTDADPSRTNTGKLDQLTVAIARLEAASRNGKRPISLPVWALAAFGVITAAVGLVTLGMLTFEPATRTQLRVEQEARIAADAGISGTVDGIGAKLDAMDKDIGGIKCWLRSPAKKRDQCVFRDEQP